MATIFFSFLFFYFCPEVVGGCFLLHGCSAVSVTFPVITTGWGEGRFKWGGGQCSIREYMYTFIHGQSAFTEVTLNCRRRAFPVALWRTRDNNVPSILEGSGERVREGAGSCERRHTQSGRHVPFKLTETDTARMWGRSTWLDSHAATFSTTDERRRKRASAVILFRFDHFVITPAPLL